MKSISALGIAVLLLSMFLTTSCLYGRASAYPDIKQLTANDFYDCLGSGRNSHDNVLDWQGNNVVYSTWYSDSDVQIYVMKTSDLPGQEKAMTNAPGTNNFGTISADGSMIAFGSNQKNPNDRYYSYEVYVMSTSGVPGDEIPVTDDSLIDNDPTISGNGEIIAWHSSPSEPSGWDIKIADVSDLSNIVVSNLVTGTDDVFYPSLTTDGSAMSYYDRNIQDIYYIGTDGSGMRDLTNSIETEYNNAISGNGTKVAFNRIVDGQWEVFVYDIAQEEETRLTFNNADDILGGIDGDGSTIVYSREGQIFICDMNSEKQLTDGSFNDRNPRISGDGSTIVFESNRDGSDYDIFMVKTTPPALCATLEINPRTLNLRSKGQWITCYTELPIGYDPSEICLSSLLLNDTIRVDQSAPSAIGDYDGDGIMDLMVKFERNQVISYILSQVRDLTRLTTVSLTVTGNLNDGTAFKGSDMVTVILPKPIPK